jgi:hypothetical protein
MTYMGVIGCTLVGDPGRRSYADIQDDIVHLSVFGCTLV